MLTSSAGYPLDKTYYQTILKAMVTPIDILEPGGTIIVASACSKDFGSRSISGTRRRVWSSCGGDRFLATLNAKSLADIDEWQTEMQLKTMRVGQIQLYTPGLDQEEKRITAVQMVDLVEGAIAEHRLVDMPLRQDFMAT